MYKSRKTLNPVTYSLVSIVIQILPNKNISTVPFALLFMQWASPSSAPLCLYGMATTAVQHFKTGRCQYKIVFVQYDNNIIKYYTAIWNRQTPIPICVYIVWQQQQYIHNNKLKLADANSNCICRVWQQHQCTLFSMFKLTILYYTIKHFETGRCQYHFIFVQYGINSTHYTAIWNWRTPIPNCICTVCQQHQDILYSNLKLAEANPNFFFFV